MMPAPTMPAPMAQPLTRASALPGSAKRGGESEGGERGGKLGLGVHGRLPFGSCGPCRPCCPLVAAPPRRVHPMRNCVTRITGATGHHGFRGMKGPAAGQTALSPRPRRQNARPARREPGGSSKSARGKAGMVEPAGVVVVEVRENDRRNIARRIETHRVQPGPDLLVRRDPDRHLLVEGVPARQIARHRVAPGVAGVDEEAALGCSIRKHRIGNGSTQRSSRKISILRPTGPRSGRPVCCAVFMRALPVSIAVTLIIDALLKRMNIRFL